MWSTVGPVKAYVWGVGGPIEMDIGVVGRTVFMSVEYRGASNRDVSGLLRATNSLSG